MTLTATAPPDTLQKLKDSFQNPVVLKASIDRPNISLHTRRSKFGGQLPAAVTNGKMSAGCISLFYYYYFLICMLINAYVDAYWTPFVEEMAQEIGNSPTIIYVDSKKSALDLTTSFNQHSEIKAAAYTGKDTIANLTKKLFCQTG